MSKNIAIRNSQIGSGRGVGLAGRTSHNEVPGTRPGDIVAAEPTREIPALLNRLEGGSEALAEALTRLEDRLSHVLPPHAPAGEEPMLEADTHYGAQLTKVIAGIEFQINRVARLTASVAV